jgi:hypothetical protein
MKPRILGKFFSRSHGCLMALVFAFGLVYLLPANLADQKG